jgi:hypothetical protein
MPKVIDPCKSLYLETFTALSADQPSEVSRPVLDTVEKILARYR